MAGRRKYYFYRAENTPPTAYHPTYAAWRAGVLDAVTSQALACEVGEGESVYVPEGWYVCGGLQEVYVCAYAFRCSARPASCVYRCNRQGRPALCATCDPTLPHAILRVCSGMLPAGTFNRPRLACGHGTHTVRAPSTRPAPHGGASVPRPWVTR